MSASTRESKLPLSDLPRRREVLGLLLLGLALFLGLALASFQLGNRALAGPFGHACALALYGLFGIVGYLVVAQTARAGLRVLAGARAATSGWEWAGFALGLPSICTLVYLALGSRRIEGIAAGGLLGEYGGALLRAALGSAGALLVAGLGVVLGLLATTPFRAVSALRMARRAGGALRNAARATAAVMGHALVTLFPGGSEDEDGEARTPRKREKGAPANQASVEEAVARLGRGRRERRVSEPAPAGASELLSASDTERMAISPEIGDAKSIKGPSDEVGPASELPVIIESRLKKNETPAERPAFIMSGAGGFHLPTLDLLDYVDPGVGEVDRSAMHEMALRLQQTLETYGVNGKVTEIHPGPVVTMYEFVPEAGTRVSKIASLQDDLAMALEAMRVRIVAPIPGKNAVGIEVPNRSRETVYLKEILADEAFSRARSKLTMALGKDIAGRPVVVDLNKMPHLLVAGTTGSGKSVSVNSMVCSLLYGASPEEVRLIMVDPKMLELSVYEGVPHLLLPVVTDPKKANLALRWAVEEMERRYERLAAAGVRDLAAYNKKVEKRGESALPVESVELEVEGAGGVETVAFPAEVTADGTAPNPAPRAGRLPPDARKLPYIVIIIDEFADLMMVASKEVETSVARIAQKARAAGIHLLLATQRPSVDVITGLIKANFPSRIAFQVSSKVDARTILDQGGAEALLGQGDMLFSDRGGALQRVHGCLVTDGEIARIVEVLKRQGTPVYDMEILKPRDEEGEEGSGDEEIDDEMYDQAVRVVAETRQASISMVQRRLRVGYNRAARMIERMEREGIVGPADGPNRREVLVSSQ